MKRFYTQFFVCILGFCMILVLFSACGSSSHTSKEAAPSGLGSVSFELNWGSSPAPKLRALSPSGNACTDYGIENIEAKVYKDTNAVIASASCSCEDSQNMITDIPEGSGYSLVIEGLISGESEWRGGRAGITVIPGETTELGSISINYIGDDLTPPGVNTISPDGDTNVSISINIIVQFDENIVEASLNPNTFILEGGGNLISGNIKYDPNSRIATFAPAEDLSYLTTYTVTLKKEIEDKGSNELPYDISWSFTTEMASLFWDEGKWDEANWVN